jgi:hypothetical protein
MRQPITPKPTSIIIHVAGSGTAPTDAIAGLAIDARITPTAIFS